MANGFGGCCPTCGMPQQQGMWQGGPMMVAPPYQGQWQGGPVMVCQPMMQPAWGMQQFAGPMVMGGGPYAPAYYGNLPSDAEIEEMIYDALDADPLIPFDADIDITVDAGTVYLRGEVPSKRIKHAAGDDAWWIPGVDDVHNDIKVTPRKQKQPAGQEAQA